jgi:predicted ATPase
MVDGTIGAGTRHRMLETVRHYAAARLDSADEAPVSGGRCAAGW